MEEINFFNIGHYVTLFILGFLIYLMVYCAINIAENREKMKECNNLGIPEGQCNQCYYDCYEFGMEYYKYQYGDFSPSNCWCLNPKTKLPTQIW